MVSRNSSISMTIVNRDKSHKVAVDLPAAAVACLSLGGTLDITDIILPLLKAEAEASFVGGFERGCNFQFSDEGECDLLKEASDHAKAKYQAVS